MRNESTREMNEDGRQRKKHTVEQTYQTHETANTLWHMYPQLSFVARWQQQQQQQYGIILEHWF